MRLLAKVFVLPFLLIALSAGRGYAQQYPTNPPPQGTPSPYLSYAATGYPFLVSPGPPSGYPPLWTYSAPSGYNPLVRGPLGHTLTTPPSDPPVRLKPLITPLHKGPVATTTRDFFDVHNRAPEGIPSPLGPGNVWTEFKYVFGSARQWLGTAEATYGQFRRTYVLP